MKTDQIRSKFLDFFEKRGHKVFTSDRLSPAEDKSVLFTSAGMNQFKPYFLGLKTGVKRAVSSQKCFRTDDLEKVGKTSSHHTFFEMLGNFSFGDYFKEDAIMWAWEFVRDVIKIKQERVWVSVYKEDEESFNIWIDKIGFPSQRIVKLGADKNFWPADAIKNGPNGPCGPCSEIFYDLGESSGCCREGCNPGCDCGRFIEIWNLVFTQFNRKDNSGEGVLEPLPTKNIDTGMGLERVASVLQNVDTNFKIDIFKPLIKEIELKVKDLKKKPSPDIYAIADHIRAAVFAVSEGVLPSNEERGYVVRKIIRKAVWHGYKLGIRELFLYKLVATVAAVMKEAYPELEDRREYISSILKSEEERFQNTIDSGLMKLSSLMARLKKDKKTVIAGKEVFKLYDTFGFPYELTGKVAQENGFDIDIDGFSSALEEQKERSKSFSQIKEEIFSKDKELLKDIAATDFVGYESVSCESEILAILNEDLDRELSVIKEGKAVIVASKTPFYGKGGGQVADKGEISSKDFLAEVFDVKNIDERVLHFVEIVKGSIKKKSKVSLEVDREKRLAAARNHTATHLLHRALKEVLGDSVEQAGSYVDSKKLRFDFNYFKALSSDELEEVEDRVNNYILANLKLNVKVLAYKEAKEEGALALFSEKYGEKVRVVDIAGVSKELCGGTHVSYTGDIGLFKIISESSSSGGVRRIEAVTAKEARDYYKREEVILDKVSSLLSANQFKAAIEVESLIERLNILEKEANKRELAGIDGQAIDLISKAKKIKSALFVAAELDKDIDIDYISKLSDKIKMRSKNNTVIMLYSLSDNKVKIILSLTKDLTEKGLDARVIFDRISKVIDGGGGGRADFVKAGGKDISKLKEALNLMREYIGDNL